MPPRQKVIILKQNLMGDWIDDEGNRYNEKDQRIDYLGRVIPEPWEEPATSSLGNGGAGAFQPQTLADYNCPDFFYRRRAALRAEKNRLHEEPPEKDSQFQEIPDSEVWARVLKHREENSAYFKKLDEIFGFNTKITSQGMIVHERVEKNVGLEDSGLLSVDRDVSVDRQKGFSGQSSSFVHLSADTVVSVDRQEPMQPDSGVLTSLDPSKPPPEPPIHVHEPHDPDPDFTPPDPDPEPSDSDPKPPEHHETELVEVLPEEAVTPGSCHKRKFPDTTLQPPHKLLRAYTGVAVIPIAADLIDPGDTYAVYSRGPRPPPEQWYVLFELPSSLAGRCSYPPSAHPDDSYLIDPEKTDAVYHMGPRPP